MKTWTCKECGEGIDGKSPQVLVGHYKDAHPELVEKKKRQRAKAKAQRLAEAQTSEPEEQGPSPAERENELLVNVADWFDQAALSPDANRRVLGYLGSRFAPVGAAFSVNKLAGDVLLCSCRNDDDSAPGPISD